MHPEKYFHISKRGTNNPTPISNIGRLNPKVKVLYRIKRNLFFPRVFIHIKDIQRGEARRGKQKEKKKKIKVAISRRGRRWIGSWAMD